MARALGWVSLGLGATQLIAPRRVARLIGLGGGNKDQTTMRLLGLREVASGVAILGSARPTPGLWARVGGDAMDLTLLGLAMGSPQTDRTRAVAATLGVAGIAAMDLVSSLKLGASPSAPGATKTDQTPRVAAAVTVNAPIAEVFALWDGFQHLPLFMQDAATVRVTGERQSRWTVTGPGNTSIEWAALITERQPNQLISWRTADGAPVTANGTVRFRIAPGNRGVQVLFEAEFDPPGAGVGDMIAAPLAKAMSAKLGNDLRRFKQLVELGEVVRSDDSIIPGPNPAQPVAEVPADIELSATVA
jgi:uncharacterized membrane protein